MENKKIIKKSGLYLIGNLSSKILTSLLVPIYAFYVTSADLGTYDYSHTIMNILIPILFISVWDAIIRFVLSEKNEREKEKAIASSAVFTCLMNAVILVCGLSVGFLFHANDIIYLTLMISAGSLAQIWQFYSRALGRNTVYVCASLGGTSVNLGLNILLVCVAHIGLSALYISFIIGQLCVFLIAECFVHVHKYIKRANFDIDILRRMLRFSAPLVANSIAMWLISGFGRTVIVNELGASENGLYSFANRFVNIVNVFGSVISMAILEEAMISLREKGFDDKYPQTIETLFRFFQSLILTAVPALVLFYNIFSATEYYESVHFLPILFLYAVFLTMATNLGVAFNVLNKTSIQFTTTILGAVITVAVSYSLITVIGIYGVLIGQCAGALSMMTARYLMINRFVSFKIHWLPILIKMIIYLGSATLLTYSSLYINIFAFLLCALFALYDNKSLLIDLFNRK